MPIASTDILFKLSNSAASSGHSTNGTPSGSLGKYIASGQISSGVTLNNLFDDVSGDENAASDIEYRCFFIHNAHASLTYLSPVIWISGQVAGGASGFLAIDNYNASAIAATGQQAQSIADEGTAPTGLSFSAPTGKSVGLSLGDIGAGSGKAVWVRRNAYNTVAVNNDGITILVEGDSGA